MPSEQYCPLPPFAAVAFIWVRQWSDLGLASAYKDDAETGKWLKHFFGLSLLPPDEVGDAFADIMADAPQNSPCEAFADYMLNTYVAPDSRFPPTLWASAPTAEELPRTNNGCESFHSHLSKSFSGPHPNTYHFSNALLLYQTMLHSAAEHSVSKTSEETGRNPKGLHKNLGFVYNRPNQSQRLHLQNVLQVFTSTLVVGSYHA